MAAFQKIVFTFLVFLYLFAYGIKLAGIPISIYLFILSTIYIFRNKLMPKFTKLWIREIAIILFVVIYLWCLEAMLDVAFSIDNYSFYVIRILIDGITPAYVLADIAKKIKIKFSDFVSILVAILVTEFIFSSAMLAEPGLKNDIFVYVYNYTEQNVLLNEVLFENRGFGIAYTYLAWFPFALAMIFSFCLYSNIVQSKIFLSLLALITVILIAMNARIGFVPLVIGILMYIFVSGAQGIKKISGVALIVALIITFAFYILSLLDVTDQLEARVEFFKKWVIEEGFQSIFTQEGSSTIRDLSNFQILSDFNFSDYIFGRGNMLVPENVSLYTDVGYMQTLYTGGLILSFFLYALFTLFFKRLNDLIRTLCAKGIIPHTYKYFPFVIGASFFIGHGKLRIFEINEASRFLLLLISYFIVLSWAYGSVPKLNYLKFEK